MEVIGRQAELLAIGAWISAGNPNLRESSSERTVLVVEGEPGIGKTTVWEEAIRVARAHGSHVLSCRPRQSDAALSHVALTDLLRSVPTEAFRSLPAPQRFPAYRCRACGKRPSHGFAGAGIKLPKSLPPCLIGMQ